LTFQLRAGRGPYGEVVSDAETTVHTVLGRRVAVVEHGDPAGRPVFLFHGTPARLMHAVQAATPAVWGVILQFPFYAGIAGVITGTHLNEQLANLFVRISTPTTFPALVALYSAVLGVFVPSGGSKWVIEAPYVMAAAHQLKVHLGWVVTAYDLGEALANLLQPFWMLPILGLFQLRARDVMGYTFVVFVVLLPTVLLLVTVLGRTLSHPL